MAARTIVETWTGPGRRDEVIRPVPAGGNGAHLARHRYAFEHWYFDAVLDNGYLVVAFLQSRELVTRKPGVEVHVYAPDGTRRTLVKRYPAHAVSTSPERCEVHIGPNSAVLDAAESGLPVHRLRLAEEDIALDLTFRSEVPAWMPGDGKTLYGDVEYFAWVVGAPRAAVTGTVRVGDTTMDARGRGYHDHNWGVADMKRIIDRWYWGRIYADDLTLVYASVLTTPGYGASWVTPLMLAYKDSVVLSTGQVTVTPGNPRFDATVRRPYPDSLHLAVADQLDLRLDVRAVVHAHDLLDDLPVARNRVVKPLLRAVVGRPGYFRFRSDFTLSAVVDGATQERTGTALHEMVALR
ncbi:MAG TPA: lipocalin-like domain-containing protein [Rugosimonospora sp.]|nr:lipocalin-like domain-containing protein [Rugosimonospora sp.]